LRVGASERAGTGRGRLDVGGRGGRQQRVRVRPLRHFKAASDNLIFSPFSAAVALNMAAAGARG
jgi:hypothetical protein